MNHVPLIWHYVVHKVDEISSLSTSEFIAIVASYNKLLNGKDSDQDIQNRNYPPEALAELKRRSKGSFAEVVSLGLRFTKPLNEFKTHLLNQYFYLFECYERGALPFPGSASEQPAQIIEVFNTIQALRSEQEEKHRKKLERDERKQRQVRARAGR